MRQATYCVYECNKKAYKDGVFPFHLILGLGLGLGLGWGLGLGLGSGLRHALRHDALSTSVSNNFVLVHVRRIGIRRNGAEP